MGLRFAAFFAGYQPKKIPMPEQTKNEIRMALVMITNGKFNKLVATYEISNPNKIPIIPPIMVDPVIMFVPFTEQSEMLPELDPAIAPA